MANLTQKRLITSLRRWVRPDDWRRRMVFWGGAIATGTIAVAFATASTFAMQLFTQAHSAWPWWSFVATPLGLVLAVWATRKWFSGAEGSGIPQTIAALALSSESARDRVLSLRIALGKILVTLLALASGASVGREGPTVQVGASIMHALRRYARFRAVDIDRGLILAGGAAGVAAAFNTPLAGVVFAIEELSRSFEERTSGVILTAVIVAGVTALALVGSYTYFGSTSAVLTDARMWAVVPVCGLAGGLLGGAFSRTMLWMGTSLPGPLGRARAERPLVFAAACGLMLAAIGWCSGGSTFGTGYSEARGILQNEGMPAAGFFFYKALATLVSYLSGVPGGIFAPSLAVGAGLGGQLYAWMPLAPIGAMVVLSMAAYFAGVVQAPLTALVIVTEMTDNRGLTLPLMAVVLLGRISSAAVCRAPLYRTLARGFIPATQASAAVVESKVP